MTRRQKFRLGAPFAFFSLRVLGVRLMGAGLVGLLCSNVALASESSTLWRQPKPEDLEAVFRIRAQVDLSNFELLKINAEEWSAPYIGIGNTVVYVATSSGRLQARSLSDNRVLWERRDLGTMGVSMTEEDDLLVLGSGTDLVSVELASGRERWRVPIGGRIGGRLAREGSLAILPVRPNGFVAVDLAQASVRWRIKRPTPSSMTVRGQASPTIDAERGQVYLGFSDGALVAVSLESGTKVWEAALGRTQDFFADVDAQPVLVDGGTAVLAASYNGGLFKLSPEDGAVVWRREDLKRITGLVHIGSDRTIVVGAMGDGQVVGLRADDGRVGWRYRLAEGSPTEPVDLGDDRVAVGASFGSLAILRGKTGRPLEVILPGSGLSVAPTWRAPNLTFMSNGGYFFSLREIR
ncbi:MAG: PQQ-binding-like beta-propeller repeat protein [Deltaproteobacteria bacterium]|nr:PQQ-binding-like beta-propeller repeat protein [Deltaproteobacteria bacterium]